MDLGPPQADRHDGEKHRLRPLARQALARPIPSDGTKEINAIYYPRNAYGGLPGVNGQAREGSTNTETGYTGASTPNGTGGFGYLRNRWYDPKTGRFLTQDPIGLTGGLNAYEYAGSNPVLFDDPFGLCQTSAGGVDHYYDVCTLEETMTGFSLSINMERRGKWSTR